MHFMMFRDFISSQSGTECDFALLGETAELSASEGEGGRGYR